MNNHKSLSAEASPRSQANILTEFNGIVETYLNAIPRKRLNAEAFYALQKYLDETVSIDGVRFRRRGVLLAVHDMKEKVEAPAVLQERTRVRAMSLEMRPLPELKHCSDIATAILRAEAVMRQSAREAPQAVERQPRHFTYAADQRFDRLQQRLHVSLAAAVLKSKSLHRFSLAHFDRLRLLFGKLALLFAAHMRLAWREPSVRRHIELQST